MDNVTFEDIKPFINMDIKKIHKLNLPREKLVLIQQYRRRLRNRIYSRKRRLKNSIKSGKYKNSPSAARRKTTDMNEEIICEELLLQREIKSLKQAKNTPKPSVLIPGMANIPMSGIPLLNMPNISNISSIQSIQSISETSMPELTPLESLSKQQIVINKALLLHDDIQTILLQELSNNLKSDQNRMKRIIDISLKRQDITSRMLTYLLNKRKHMIYDEREPQQKLTQELLQKQEYTSHLTNCLLQALMNTIQFDMGHIQPNFNIPFVARPPELHLFTLQIQVPQELCTE